MVNSNAFINGHAKSTTEYEAVQTITDIDFFDNTRMQNGVFRGFTPDSDVPLVKALSLFKKYNWSIQRTVLIRPDAEIFELMGSAMVEAVQCGPDEKLCLYPSGGADGDTGVTVLLESLVICGVTANSIKFEYYEHGAGSIEFFWV